MPSERTRPLLLLRGGRGRLSCLFAGVVLLVLVVFASDWVGRIPMAALVGVMIMVSISTFQWRSFADMRTYPRSATLIMLGTVVVTVATHDLAIGVLTGVLLTALSFARRASAMLRVESRDTAEGARVYEVKGEVFFASATQFVNSFDYLHAPRRVLIDLTHAHFWDLSAVGALDRVVLKLRAHGPRSKWWASTPPANRSSSGSASTAAKGPAWRCTERCRDSRRCLSSSTLNRGGLRGRTDEEIVTFRRRSVRIGCIDPSSPHESRAQAHGRRGSGNHGPMTGQPGAIR